MPLNLRASEKIQDFSAPVSYRIQDNQGKFLDARNVQSIQGRLDTRFGYTRFNAAQIDNGDFGGKIESLSFFKKSDGSRYTLAKNGSALWAVSEAGAHTDINSNGFLSGKHRGITWNDRHIFCVEGQGLFAWDGTILSQLGQAAPLAAPTLTAPNAAGSLVTTNVYRVAITFVATSIGFESNYTESLPVTVTTPNLEILVSGLPITAANGFIDKVNIYLKNVTTDSEYLYVGQASLGTATYLVSSESTSSQMPPTQNDVPGRNANDLNGGVGAKYLASFNSKLVFAGNSGAPNEVYFSQEDLPDAFDSTDTAIVLPIPGQGEITGLGVGLFGDSVLDPFLVIFKRKSTRIYSEIGGQAKLVVLSNEIGCVSHDTITIKNGVLYFLSEEGWRGIASGRFITNQQGEAITLGNGDIDDIFKSSSGYTYEVNRTGMAGAFSVYYPTLDQYMTWVSEGANAAYSKTYVYEFDVGGFKPWEFGLTATCAMIGENSSGRDMVLFGTNDGYIMRHSILENRTDKDAANADLAINAYAVLPWKPKDGDYDASYNFRELILKAIVSSNALTVKTYLDYNLSTVESGDYNFTDANSGFILDESLLDEGVLSDDRSLVTARSDINRVGENIAIGFYQNIVGANIGLVSMQVDSSKNGNRNLASDDDDALGGFDAGDSTYYPSVSQSVQDASAYATAAAISAAAAAASALAAGEAAIVGREILLNNQANNLTDIGEYLADYRSIIVEYYLYRRVSGTNKRMSGRIIMESVPDGATNPDKWTLVEVIRSEFGGASGVTFSLSDIATEKSILVATLDNMAGTGHECTIFFRLTKLATATDVTSLANNAVTTLSVIGTYLGTAKCVLVDYYIYRRTDSNFKTMSGKIYLEGVSDGATNPDKWALFEAERSENLGASGVTFSLSATDTEKSVLVATLDNMAGTNYDCKFYYKQTLLTV